MRRVPLRSVFLGPRDVPERVFFTSHWFRGHNNPRYAELIPRLSRLDALLIVCSQTRWIRGTQFRVLGATRRARHRLLLGGAGRRYRWLFTADPEQIPYFNGATICDVDDPRFTAREVQLLSGPSLAAYVVTAERAGKRFEELGVDKPWHVVPQGVSLASYSEAEALAIARRFRRPGQVVVGFMAAWLLSGSDRDGSNSLYNVDHLLDLWDEIHSRVPSALLWLIGGASARVQARCEARPDIRLFGRVPREDLLSYVANFDIALYPRTQDVGIQAVKVAEYMGVGVPTVSYDYQVTEPLRANRAGILVQTPRQFAEAVERLSLDEEYRRQLARNARVAGAALDWNRLADRYDKEIFGEYFSAATE